MGLKAWSQPVVLVTSEEREMMMYWDILENWDLFIEELDDPEFWEDGDFEGDNDENQE